MKSVKGLVLLKYNPKINDKIANTEKMTALHPLQDEKYCSRDIGGNI